MLRLCARNFGAMSLALLGEDERARAMMDSAVAAASNLNDPFSLALTLYFASAAAQMLGDVPLAVRNSEACMQLATQHSLALPKAWSAGVTGWCAAENGERARGFALLTEATDALRAMQTLAFVPYLLGLLADARIKAGYQSEAMKAAEQGIAMTDATGERFYSAELHRLHGELLAHSSIGQPKEAEAAFRTAIKIANQQGALSLERKASKSLRRRAG